jgi:hypothetical protein
MTQKYQNFRCRVKCTGLKSLTLPYIVKIPVIKLNARFFLEEFRLLINKTVILRENFGLPNVFRELNQFCSPFKAQAFFGGCHTKVGLFLCYFFFSQAPENKEFFV